MLDPAADFVAPLVIDGQKIAEIAVSSLLP